MEYDRILLKKRFEELPRHIYIDDKFMYSKDNETYEMRIFQKAVFTILLISI